MQKVYLLLRDNQKTGPYSLQELLDLQLKPFDLVWVDGRSTGWRYPAEIDSLKPYTAEPSKPASPTEPLPASALEQNTIQSDIPKQPSIPIGKKIFVSMPGKPRPVYDDNAQEEVIQPVTTQASSPIPKYAPGYQDTVSPENNRISNDPVFRERVPIEDYSGLFLPKKKKQPFLTSRSIAAGVLIVILGAAGYYFLTADKSNVPSQNLVSQSVQQPVNDNTESTDQTTEEENKTSVANSKKSTKKEKLTKDITPSQNKKPTKTNSVVLPSVDQTINEPSVPDVTDVKNKEEVVAVPPTEPAPKEKKKKLGEAIKDIFRPKEKARQEEKKETVLEDPKPATNRQSTKREEGNTESKTSTEPNIDLTGMIDITSNAPDNWMMGIKGLKLTLRNRSNAVIQTASVEVTYYNDNNQVMEKKLVYFNNVSAKGKSTIAAPDHKYADHVEFKLLTATPKEDRFARN